MICQNSVYVLCFLPLKLFVYQRQLIMKNAEIRHYEHSLSKIVFLFQFEDQIRSIPVQAVILQESCQYWITERNLLCKHCRVALYCIFYSATIFFRAFCPSANIELSDLILIPPNPKPSVSIIYIADHIMSYQRSTVVDASLHVQNCLRKGEYDDSAKRKKKKKKEVPQAYVKL